MNATYNPRYDGTAGGWDYAPTCVNCHDPHGDGTNLSMIESNLWDKAAFPVLGGTPPTAPSSDTTIFRYNTTGVDTSAPYESYADNGVASGGDSICHECHETPTTTYAFVDDGVANVGAHASMAGDCGSCHKHDSAFKPSGCNGCHGDPVAKNYWPDTAGSDDGATSADSAGAHGLHMAWLANKVYSETLAQLLTDTAFTSDEKQKALCEYCHRAVTNDGDHTSATLAEVFDTTYRKKYWDGTLDGDAAFESTNNTCSTVDCHAQYGAAGGSESVVTPNWYVTPTHAFSTTAMNCAACHNDVTTVGSPHEVHINASGMFGIVIGCANCHDSSSSWATTTPPSTGHLNGTFVAQGSVTFSYNGTFRTSYGGCATNACHNNGVSQTTGTPRASTYQWGTTIANCDECHGDSVGTMVTNAHDEHMNASYGASSCTDCHSGPRGANHINGFVNFNTSATYSLGAAVAVGTTPDGNCLTSLCHNQSAPASAAWNTTGDLSCSSCHGYGAGAGLSTSHDDHLNKGKVCTDCHAAVTDTGHITDKASSPTARWPRSTKRR